MNTTPFHFRLRPVPHAAHCFTGFCLCALCLVCFGASKPKALPRTKASAASADAATAAELPVVADAAAASLTFPTNTAWSRAEAYTERYPGVIAFLQGANAITFSDYLAPETPGAALTAFAAADSTLGTAPPDALSVHGHTLYRYTAQLDDALVRTYLSVEPSKHGTHILFAQVYTAPGNAQAALLESAETFVRASFSGYFSALARGTALR